MNTKMRVKTYEEIKREQAAVKEKKKKAKQKKRYKNPRTTRTNK